VAEQLTAQPLQVIEIALAIVIRQPHAAAFRKDDFGRGVMYIRALTLYWLNSISRLLKSTKQGKKGSRD
jgi:hypothetical protein